MKLKRPTKISWSDLNPIKKSSIVIGMNQLADNTIALVVFGFNVTEPNAGQGILIFDRDLNLTHNLLDIDGGFTPLETGSLNHNVIYVGDNQGKLYRITL